MTDSERIIEVKKFANISFRQLAIDIGLKSVQTLYDIRNGKHGISKDVANKINAKYLINKQWLLTGEGEMLSNNVTQNNRNGDNIQGGNVTYHKENADTKKLMEMLQKRDEQIDRLISLLEKFNK